MNIFFVPHFTNGRKIDPSTCALFLLPSCEISSVGHFASCIQKYTFIKLVIMMETCWHSQKNKVYAVLFLLWRGKCWWLETEKVGTVVFLSVMVWSICWQAVFPLLITAHETKKWSGQFHRKLTVKLSRFLQQWFDFHGSVRVCVNLYLAETSLAFVVF